MIDINKIVDNFVVIILSVLVSFLFLFVSFPYNVLSMFDVNVIHHMQRDDYSKSVSLLCDLHHDSLDKFLCVVDFVDDLYYYNDTKSGYKEPREIFFSVEIAMIIRCFTVLYLIHLMIFTVLFLFYLI